MPKIKKEIFIIAGANGSGKTTFANRFIRKYRYNFINTDEIASELKVKDVEINLRSGKIFFNRIHSHLKQNESFIIESTLAGQYLVHFIKQIKEQEYLLTIIYLFLETPDLCLERIKERVLKGGHPVPEKDVVRRYYRSKTNFWNRYKNLADKWYIIHNGKQEFVRIAMGIKEKYIVNNQPLFDIFIKDVKI
jgi:predicted ABC-type ATPase